MSKGSYWSCSHCGRCYDLNGVELTSKAEDKMKSLEKSWIQQGEMTLCCREGYDKFRINSKINKKYE